MEVCIPRQKPDFHLEKLDDELLLYHPSNTVIMYCNPTASLIWQLCDGKHSTEEIVSLLSAAYEQNVETVSSEVENTLAQFHQHEAIEYVDESGQPLSQKSG